MRTDFPARAANRAFPESAQLFGREHDLDAITNMLRSPECRLVTLAGSGGVGKTRLAQHLVELLSDDFEDGVHFIPLHALTSAQQLPAAVLEHLGCRIQGADAPDAQLFHFLRNRCVLVVLDNAEHLPDVRSFLIHLLEQTQHLKLLVTTREVLNLQQEWVWMLRGIAYPHNPNGTDARNDAAVRLFESRARQVIPQFSLQNDLPAIVEICSLVEGNPLAIELAAAWLRSLPSREILAELRRSMDILSTDRGDVPQQHRSLCAVFDHSWRLLTADEQLALMKLSLFQGHFTRDAAHGAAGVTLHTLNRLINKSLLYHHYERGTYQFHELFRHYTFRHLLTNHDRLTAAQTAYTAYYRDFLAIRAADLWTSRQRQIIHDIAAELPHIRRFASNLVVNENVTVSRKAVYVLSEVYQLLGHYRDAVEFLSDIISQLDRMGEGRLGGEQFHLLGEALNGLGWASIRLGDFKTADTVLERSQSLYDTYQLQIAEGLGTDPRGARAELCLALGNAAAAQTLGKAVYNDALQRNDPLNSSTGLYLLSAAALMAGDCRQAQVFARQAIRLTRRTGNDWFLACCLYQLGHICCNQGDYTGASIHYQESFSIREALGDLEGQAVALMNLGRMALLQEDNARAADLFEQALEHYERIGDRGGLLATYQGLAIARTALHQFELAHEHLLDAVQLTRETRLSSWWLSMCEAVGEFFAATGALERGALLVRLALDHADTSSATRIRAGHWLRQAHVSGTNSPAADLNTVIHQLERELLEFVWDTPASGYLRNGHSNLIEMLSARELEVLHLIAQGMTNQEIADHLVLMVSTVKTYNYSIFGKLAVKNRGQAVIRARQLQLL